MEGSLKQLGFVPFSSSVNPSFWSKLTEIKLDVDRLSDKGRKIWGSFSILGLQTKPLLEVDSTSFNSTFSAPNTQLPFHGMLYNKNTVEQFRDCNFTELIEGEGCRIWNLLENGEALKNPSLLNQFFIISFADLKKYNFLYWFAFPVLAKIQIDFIKIVKIESLLNENTMSDLLESYNSLENNQKPFFLVNKNNPGKCLEIHDKIHLDNKENLSDFSEFYFAFADPSPLDDNPGWTLRNYITLLLFYCPEVHGKTVDFLSLRLSRHGAQISFKTSLIFTLKLPDFNGSIKKEISERGGASWSGWEVNERGKLGPQRAEMKDSIDPKCLAANAVDLNLKLMKWRILPDIDLEKIKDIKCLLFGAGTLGCSVARTLLGWGVRNITFLDNSTVSLSNPVRQSLFTYEDSEKNRPKAKAAADNLKKIFPGVNSNGYRINVPMPGHTIGESLLSQTMKDTEELTRLISDHDIIFLLMDSRESRWLPSVLANHFGKIVINAALGFDTYLVMRHGVRTETEPERNIDIPEGFKHIEGRNLGCYFCNDITAPGNSMKDRTLDQTCTVSRPGVANIAGSLAVELAISILQHNKGGGAPAFYQSSKDHQFDMSSRDECILGVLPHSIRGFLSTFSHVLPATEKFKQCIACSEIVLDAYRTKGFDFLLEVFNSSKYLEQLTGLDKFYTEPIDNWDIGSDEEDF